MQTSNTIKPQLSASELPARSSKWVACLNKQECVYPNHDYGNTLVILIYTFLFSRNLRIFDFCFSVIWNLCCSNSTHWVQDENTRNDNIFAKSHPYQNQTENRLCAHVTGFLKITAWIEERRKYLGKKSCKHDLILHKYVVICPWESFTYL